MHSPDHASTGESGLRYSASRHGSRPEDVILAKLYWRLESRSEVQWRDCVEIAATQPLELEYMRMWADRLGVADDLEDLFDRS